MATHLTVYYFSLASVEPAHLQCLASERLPATEQAVAERYRHLSRRCQYLAGRLLLRGLLAQRHRCPPCSFDFTIGPYGKPELAGGPCFNLAHTDHYVALAISDSAEVGVDIETLARGVEPDELASAVLHPLELEAFAAMTSDARRDYFLALWSAKEAYVKASGRGIAYGLPKLRVDFTCARVIGPDGVASLAAMTPPPGHAGALIGLGPGPAQTAEFRITDLAALTALPVSGHWND